MNSAFVAQQTDDRPWQVRVKRNNAISVVTYPFNSGASDSLVPSDYDLPAREIEATGAQLGTSFGLAWQRSSSSLFAAAFMKRHALFGPGGTGAIYRINRLSHTVSKFLDLNQLFGSPVAGLDPHTPSDLFHDADAWDAVGKISLGGMDFFALAAWREHLPGYQVHPVPTASWVRPKFVERLLSAGVARVLIVRDARAEAAARDGNRWIADRLSGVRAPAFRPARAGNPTDGWRVVDFDPSDPGHAQCVFGHPGVRSCSDSGE